MAKLSSEESFINVKDLIKTYAGINGQASESQSRSSGINSPQANGEAKIKMECGNAYAEDVLAHLDQEDAQECPICMDVMQSPVLIPGCMHQWFVPWQSNTKHADKFTLVARTASPRSFRDALTKEEKGGVQHVCKDLFRFVRRYYVPLLIPNIHSMLGKRVAGSHPRWILKLEQRRQ